ncbi:hypothetical protein K1719_044021 [Acacia pycnantha]|nr:hypothetical protein K1719_044021 [Acacia pycnantha]
MGCATQVWVIAEMDELGRIRFEPIAIRDIKGFLLVLNLYVGRREPEEVLMVAAEDLAEMNMGLHVKAQSRVRHRASAIVD